MGYIRTLQDESAVFVLRHGYDVDIIDSDVKETRRPKGDDGRPDVTAGNDLYPKNIRYWTSGVRSARAL
jgi:hypothetical protein